MTCCSWPRPVRIMRRPGSGARPAWPQRNPGLRCWRPWPSWTHRWRGFGGVNAAAVVRPSGCGPAVAAQEPTEAGLGRGDLRPFQELRRPVQKQAILRPRTRQRRGEHNASQRAKLTASDVDGVRPGPLISGGRHWGLTWFLSRGTSDMTGEAAITQEVFDVWSEPSRATRSPRPRKAPSSITGNGSSEKAAVILARVTDVTNQKRVFGDTRQTLHLDVKRVYHVGEGFLHRARGLRPSPFTRVSRGEPGCSPPRP